MFRLFIDTCVWLDLAKDYKQQVLLAALEQLIQQGDVELILPRTVVDEFARNRARVIEDSSRSLSSTLKRVKDAVETFGDPRRKRMVLRQLNDVDHRLPTLGEAAVGTIARIAQLFARTPVIEISDAVKLRAAQRAIDKRAPFHRQRNGIADALLIEVYADAVAAKGPSHSRFAFVTHNTNDFSHPAANSKLPHPDIAGYFSRIRSLYFITLGEADLMIEEQWLPEPRRLTEILNAIDHLCTKVWYNRHQVTREKIECGEITLVDQETFPVTDHARRPIQRDVWQGALKAAVRVEAKYGMENLGPWDDFEWGMSASR